MVKNEKMEEAEGVSTHFYSFDNSLKIKQDFTERYAFCKVLFLG